MRSVWACYLRAEFLAAHKTLLLALDPGGHRWGPDHPPYICRRAMLWHACQHLGWSRYAATIKDKELREDVNAFLRAHVGEAPGGWEDMFRPSQVAAAVDALRGILAGVGTPEYAMPGESALKSLTEMLCNRVPPCGSDLSGSREPKSRKVDFRDILFAGWVVADKLARSGQEEEQSPRFLELNKLCELGLLQQRAIDLELAGKGVETA